MNAWINAYNLSVTTVTPVDPNQQLVGERETVFIVDLCTMKIVDKVAGSQAGIGDSSAKTAIAKILTLLGK